MTKRLSPLLLIYVLSLVFNSCKSPVDPAVEARLQQEVATFNQNRQVTGNGISMDSASTSGTTLQFNFTLLNNRKIDFDSTVFAARAKMDVLATLNAGENAVFFRDNGIRITYNYYDRNGILMNRVRILPEDYEQQGSGQ